MFSQSSKHGNIIIIIRTLTLRLLTDEAITILTALLIVPLPCEVEVVVVGQNSTQRYTEQLFFLGCNEHTLVHTNPHGDQTEGLPGVYSEIAPRFNRRPVAVAGPSCVALPQTNPYTDRASLKQHGDVCCTDDDTPTEQSQKEMGQMCFLAEFSRNK